MNKTTEPLWNGESAAKTQSQSFDSATLAWPWDWSLQVCCCSELLGRQHVLGSATFKRVQRPCCAFTSPLWGDAWVASKTRRCQQPQQHIAATASRGLPAQWLMSIFFFFLILTKLCCEKNVFWSCIKWFFQCRFPNVGIYFNILCRLKAKVRV